MRKRMRDGGKEKRMRKRMRVYDELPQNIQHTTRSSDDPTSLRETPP
jgi:hypothetical protein